MERRLAAIMAAYVVSYSRLFRAGTIAALKALRADLIDPKIAEHHGRIVKLMGDGMLAEFASVVDAVNFAVDVQHAIRAYGLCRILLPLSLSPRPILENLLKKA
jgi:adenylate cyclase